MGICPSQLLNKRLLGTRLLGGGKTERRPPAPALGPGSELLQSSDLEEPRPAGISHPERELRPSTRGRQGRCCPCDAGARTCTWPTSSSRPKQGYVRGQTLPNQKRGKKVIPCPCMSRKPRGKQAAEKAGSRALGRFLQGLPGEGSQSAFGSRSPAVDLRLTLDANLTLEGWGAQLAASS